jgi:hypothetical protein
VIQNHQLSLQKPLAYICNVCLGQRIRNHLVSIETMEPLLLALRRKKPGGEIPANHSILKLNRKSVQELSPPFKGGVAGPLGYRRPGGGG